MTATAPEKEIVAGLEYVAPSKRLRAFWLAEGKRRGWELVYERPIPQSYGTRMVFVRRAD